jgi:hypothetical protein
MESLNRLARDKIPELQQAQAIRGVEAKTKLKEAIKSHTMKMPGQGPMGAPAPVPPPPKMVSAGELKALAKATEATDNKKAEPKRVALVKKLFKYQQKLPEACVQVKQHIKPNMDLKTAEYCLSVIKEYLGGKGARVMVENLYAGVVTAGEKLTHDYGWNPMNLDIRGISNATQHLLSEDPRKFEPELTEAEIDLGDWVVHDWPVRMLAKTYSFFAEYSVAKKRLQAMQGMGQKAAESTVPLPVPQE